MNETTPPEVETDGTKKRRPPLRTSRPRRLGEASAGFPTSAVPPRGAEAAAASFREGELSLGGRRRREASSPKKSRDGTGDDGSGGAAHARGLWTRGVVRGWVAPSGCARGI